MRRFLLSSVAALALTVATGALAASPDNTQTNGTSGTAATGTGATGVTEGSGTLVTRDQIEARTLVGKAVYDTNGDKIGSVDDVILAPSGQGAQQAVIKSGGFLGIGEKLIAVSIADLKPGRDKDTLVVNGLTRQQVRDMRAFAYDHSTRSWRNTQTAAGDGTVGNGTIANGTAGTGTMANGPAVAPAPAVNSVQPRMLIGKEVVDANGKRIGTVDNILMDASGSKPEKVIIASGGFLGIGQKLIAVDFSQLSLPGAEAAEINAANANNGNGTAVNGNNGQGTAATGNAAQNGAQNGMVDQNGNAVPANGTPAINADRNVAVVAGLTQEQVKSLPDFRYDPSMRTANQVLNDSNGNNVASAPANTGTGSSGSSATDSTGAATNGSTDNNAGATASINHNAVDLKQLIGKVVVDTNGDRVGTVDNVLMNASGDQPAQAVIASGGFLGIGKKLIAVDFSQLKLADDGRVHVTGLTREQVRDMKDFRYDPSMRTFRNSAG
jgi:sporulation protein YlmC with PRC-barrel domain